MTKKKTPVELVKLTQDQRPASVQARNAMARKLHARLRAFPDSAFAYEQSGSSFVIALRFKSGNIDVFDCVALRQHQEEPDV